jgi:hemerythrin-like metal-binding protein
MLVPVEIFPWSENFATGIAQIDDQHRELVGLLNTLVSHIAYQSDAPSLEAVFQQLSDYTAFHLRSEEEIWHRYFDGDPWEEWHRKSHGDFMAEVARLKASEATTPLETVLEQIVTVLTHWLAQHILDSDKRLAKVVLTLPSGVSLARAKEIANEEMSGSTRILIDTIMSMYDKLANRTVKLAREIKLRHEAEAAREEARAAAEAANRAKSDFLASMSHEIRTPLNAVNGMVYLLKRDAADPTMAARLDRIEQSTTHLLNVVNDILDLSKIEAGKFVVEERELTVDALLANVSSMLADRAQRKGLSLVSECEVLAGRRLRGDATRLQQALLNYAGNALKHTERGQVTLRARQSEETADSVLVRFEVEDTGAGIAEADLARLFEPFEQGRAPSTIDGGSTGLGLTITRRLAGLMGGEAGATSEPGKGSRFWFSARLGKVSGQTGDVPGREETGDPRLELRRGYAGTRILLVEDDLFNQEIAQLLLGDVGLEVDIAPDGAAALQRLAETPYPLVLMDMLMPRMGGLEATRELRKLPNGRSVPVIAMTANAFVDDRAECLAAGMNDFISKPVEPRTLYARVLHWLRHGTGGTDS